MRVRDGEDIEFWLHERSYFVEACPATVGCGFRQVVHDHLHHPIFTANLSRSRHYRTSEGGENETLEL
uniref:Putative membrane protein YMR253C family n=1 Tax=Rhizophora mucronata TaxID=61149 RepID=A0A2P2KBV4_RHIMU